MKFLVLEEDELDRMIFKRAVKSIDNDHEVQFVKNEYELVKALREDNGDIVFLSANAGNEQDVLRTIHSVRIMREKIPIILNSIGVENISVVKFMKAGATDLIPKNHFSPATLENTIAGLKNI
ncbi:MAG: response regulator [Bacteroidetes bacterium]|nr:response regulator [Bacteroidota bacterium]